jgi:hypothetical protein
MAAAIRQRHGVGAGRAGSWRHAPGWFGRSRRRTRLGPALEGLDDDHAPAAARTGRPGVGWFDRFSRFNVRRHCEETVQNPGVVRMLAETDAGPNARRRRGVSRMWRDEGANDMTGQSIAVGEFVDGVGLALG